MRSEGQAVAGRPARGTWWVERRAHSQAGRTQRERLLETMLAASQAEAWMTLGEIARLTRFPEASISAQLRHLRKRENGGFVLEKRRRTAEESLRESAHELVWEYQLRRGVWE